MSEHLQPELASEQGAATPWLVRLLRVWSGLALITFAVMLTHRSDAPIFLGRYSLSVGLMLVTLLAAAIAGTAVSYLLRQPCRQAQIARSLTQLRTRPWFVPTMLAVTGLALAGLWVFFLGNHLLTYAALRLFLAATLILGVMALLFGGSDELRPRTMWPVMAGLVLLLATLGWGTLTTYPAMYNSDEAFVFSMARNLLETGQTNPTIYRHSYPQDFGWAGVWTRLMSAWLAFSGYSFAAGRAFIFVTGWASLALLAVTARRLYDTPTAWLAVLVGAGAVLRLGYIRPDMLATLYLSLALLFFSLGQGANRWWAHLLTGLAAGFCVDAAPLGYSLGLGFALFYLGEYIQHWRRERSVKWAPFWALVLGGSMGLGLYLLLRQGATFPTGRMDSMLGEYLSATQRQLANGTGLLVIHESIFTGVVGVPALCLGAVLGIGTALRVRNRTDRLLLTLTAIWLAIIALTYYYFPPFYLLHGLPVLILLAARGFARGLPALFGVPRAAARLTTPVLCLSLLLTVWIAADVLAASRHKTLQDIISLGEEIGDILPEDAVIVASEPYYFGLLDHPAFVGGAIEGMLTTWQGLPAREAWETVSPDAVIFNETWPEPPRTEGLLDYLATHGFALLRCYQTGSYGQVELWVREVPVGMTPEGPQAGH